MIHKPYILPEPQSYTYDEKTCFPLHFCTGILIASELSQRAALLHHASLLQQSIREMTAQNIPIVTPQTSGRLSGHIFLGTASSLPENTYELTVNEKNIRIEGAGPREVLWVSRRSVRSFLRKAPVFMEYLSTIFRPLLTGAFTGMPPAGVFRTLQRLNVWLTSAAIIKSMSCSFMSSILICLRTTVKSGVMRRR